MTARVLLFLLCALAPAAVCAKPPIDYHEPPPDPPASGQLRQTSPGDLPGRVPDRLVGPGPFRRLPSVDESAWVVLAVRKQPYWKAGMLDPVLTNACRLGDFASVPLNRLVVRFDGEKGRGFLQVIPPTHRFLLIDRRSLAADDETYYFQDTGLPSCQVWETGRKGGARKLDPSRGTSLPKADRNALSNRLKEIKSWH